MQKQGRVGVFSIGGLNFSFGRGKFSLWVGQQNWHLGQIRGVTHLKGVLGYKSGKLDPPETGGDRRFSIGGVKFPYGWGKFFL